MTILRKTLALAATAVIAATLSGAPAYSEDGAGQQLYPLFTYRTGPYAPSFIPFGAGNIDYLRYVNEVEGGVNEAITFVEALRTGQKRFGNRTLTAEEGQWALENLDIDDKRLAELRAVGLISPLKTTIDNHKGETIAAKIIQWNGESWDTRTDWIKADTALFADVIKAKAAAYAKEKGIEPREAQN